MHIVFFSHPTFLKHQSMPRFTKMLVDGMKARGHRVEVLMPKPLFFNLPVAAVFRKWLGYIDQYLVFPLQVKRKLKHFPKDTLFVFTDNALGPWVPLLAKRFNVIHCHDFLAQLAACGQIQESPTGWTGRLYQRYIRKGLKKGTNFISVSKKTEQDLFRLNPIDKGRSFVVYNGLNKSFKPHDIRDARHSFGIDLQLNLADGYILHIGGNQWYKNRAGVIEIYDAWRSDNLSSLPLIMIGESPSNVLIGVREQSLYKKDIHFFSGVQDDAIELAYAGATVLLFPSLAEGFGWPIAEAMACGCPVITTNEPPMTEVAGCSAFLIDRRPARKPDQVAWARKSAETLQKVIAFEARARQNCIAAGLENARRFETAHAIDTIDQIYKKIVSNYQQATLQNSIT